MTTAPKLGIVERIAASSSRKETSELLAELDTYKYASPTTKRRAHRKAVR